MARHRNSSYSSETLSSNSSTSSQDTYASIKSTSSSISSQIKSGEFWNRFNRRSPSNSVLSLLQHIFSPKVKGEPTKSSKSSKPVMSVSVIAIEEETSFSC